MERELVPNARTRLDLLLLKELELVLLHVEGHLGSATERGVDGVGGDGERSTGL